jgi:hypothetical protein
VAQCNYEIMRKLRRAGVAGAAAMTLITLSTIGSVASEGVASAAPKVLNRDLTGYTYVEASAHLPKGLQGGLTAWCPSGDVVVGGGGYQEDQGLGEDLSASEPASGADDYGWLVEFNNARSTGTELVVVAICASSASLTNYSLQFGNDVTVPADGEVQATVTCPSGTVALGGGR